MSDFGTDLEKWHGVASLPPFLVPLRLFRKLAEALFPDVPAFCMQNILTQNYIQAHNSPQVV